MTSTAERVIEIPAPVRADLTVLGERSEFDEILHELLATRSRYDSMRRDHSSLAERARLQSALHELRAQIALVRPVI